MSNLKKLSTMLLFGLIANVTIASTAFAASPVKTLQEPVVGVVETSGVVAPTSRSLTNNKLQTIPIQKVLQIPSPGGPVPIPYPNPPEDRDCSKLPPGYCG